MSNTMGHRIDCDYWTDQYTWECTCGATRPKHPLFDDCVAKAEALRLEQGVAAADGKGRETMDEAMVDAVAEAIRDVVMAYEADGAPYDALARAAVRAYHLWLEENGLCVAMDAAKVEGE